MTVLGCHLLLELKDCNPELLNDLNFIRRTMLTTAHDVGATVVGESFHHFTPQGVTGILAIAESHISIHTWPESKYAAIDVFTCGDKMLPEKACEFLSREFNSQHYSLKSFDRETSIKTDHPNRKF